MSVVGPQEPIPTGRQPCPLVEVHRPSARVSGEAIRQRRRQSGRKPRRRFASIIDLLFRRLNDLRHSLLGVCLADPGARRDHARDIGPVGCAKVAAIA
jgi:hypothetical protein